LQNNIPKSKKRRLVINTRFVLFSKGYRGNMGSKTEVLYFLVDEG